MLDGADVACRKNLPKAFVVLAQELSGKLRAVAHMELAQTDGFLFQALPFGPGRGLHDSGLA